MDSPEDLLQIRQLLLDCGPVDSNARLRAVFIDPRIHAWRNALPEKTNRQERVDSLIELLLTEYNSLGVSAVALFLQVLYERADERTACYGRLRRMSTKLGVPIADKALQEKSKSEYQDSLNSEINKNEPSVYFQGDVTNANIHIGRGDINQVGENNERNRLPGKSD